MSASGGPGRRAEAEQGRALRRRVIIAVAAVAVVLLVGSQLDVKSNSPAAIAIFVGIVAVMIGGSLYLRRVGTRPARGATAAAAPTADQQRTAEDVWAAANGFERVDAVDTEGVPFFLRLGDVRYPGFVARDDATLRVFNFRSGAAPSPAELAYDGRGQSHRYLVAARPCTALPGVGRLRARPRDYTESQAIDAAFGALTDRRVLEVESVGLGTGWRVQVDDDADELVVRRAVSPALIADLVDGTLDADGFDYDRGQVVAWQTGLAGVNGLDRVATLRRAIDAIAASIERAGG